jgi:hypothetical protein
VTCHPGDLDGGIFAVFSSWVHGQIHVLLPQRYCH